MNLRSSFIRSSVIVVAQFIAVAVSAQTEPRRKPAEKFIIDDYSFEWTVLKTDKVKLTIEKTQDSTKVRLWDENHLVSLLLADAEKLSSALGSTDERYTKMRGAKDDAHESVDVGECKVTFWQSPKYGFTVSVGDKDSFLSRVSLDRKAANALAPQLKRSVAMAKHVDQIIDAALAAK